LSGDKVKLPWVIMVSPLESVPLVVLGGENPALGGAWAGSLIAIIL